MMFDLNKFASNIAVETEHGKTLTYAQLEKDAKTIAEVMKPRKFTFCLCENTLGSFVGYVAFMTHNIPTVLLDGSKDMDIVLSLAKHYMPEYIWIPTKRVDELGHGVPVITYEDYTLINWADTNYDIQPDLLLCLTTSGTTGSPKLVKLTEKNLRSNAESIAEYLKITEKERAITSLPMYYSFGMSVINSHLIKGATLLLTDKAVIQREFLNFLKEGKATSIAGVPYTYEMLRRLRFLKMDLPELKTMIQAGGKLNANIVKEYVESAQASGKEFIVMYGQTEAAPRMSYLPFDKALEKYASIGIAIPGGKLSVRDVNDQEITTPDTDGELIYEGPNVCMGYAECIEDLAKGDENHGVLHTGDVARFDNDGYFYITGRMKRFVKVWGNRCNLDATEQLVKAITTSCACVGVDDKITVFVTESGLEDKIKEYLVDKTGLNIRAFDVKVVDEIPTLPSGKLDYQTMQKMI
ncbi:AMP-binding protein [Prevotella sp. tf2-5]|uniref:AMP-binding protein n=1 Tax=Prevotella sp. tf2-5 TaxID=1761889 RepID=UPI0021016DD0|nr:AMP-binding protein [Prevotella sp. tf2-5]